MCVVGSQWPVLSNVGPQMFLKFARIINYIFSFFGLVTQCINQNKYKKRGKGLTPLEIVQRNAGGWRINYREVKVMRH